MKIYTKDLEPLGFKGNNIMISNWHHHYYCEVPSRKEVYVFDNFEHTVCHFELDGKQWSAFKRGTLGLVPPGCCGGLFGGKYTEDYKMDFQGDVEKIFGKRAFKKKFLEYLGRLVA